jgi:hypothetical protein
MALSPKQTLQNEIAATMVGETAPTIPTDELFGQDSYMYLNDTKQTWGAAYRQFAPFESMRRTIHDVLRDEETGPYDPWKDPQTKPYRDQGAMYRFMNSDGPNETSDIINRLTSDLDDLAVLASSDSGKAEFFAHMSTPTIFAPVLFRNVKGATFGQRFTTGAGYTAALMAPEEIMKGVQSEGYTATNSLLALTAASIISGGVTGLLGKQTTGRVFGPKLDPDEGIYRSAGAAISPEKARKAAYAEMEGDALAETGIGVENLGWNPTIRMLKSRNPYVRSVAAGLVDLGGMIQKKVGKGEAMDQSVEAKFRAKYLGPLLNSIAESDKAYLSYRGVVAKDGDIGRSIQMLRQGASDFLAGQKEFIRQVDFRIRVGKAMRRGGRDSIQDEATQFVERAAAKYREAYDFIKVEAESVNLFEKEAQGALKAAEASGDAARIKQAQDYLRNIKANGVAVNTAESYLNRVWRVDKIMDNEAEFLKRVSDWARGKYKMTSSQANKFAREMMDEVTRSKPYYDLDDAGKQFDWVANPSGVKARSFEIPDELIDDFLENDVEVLLRHHTRTMGVDIELTRAFGDIDMRSVINKVTDEYEVLIKEAKDVSERQMLKKALENDLRDIRGLRDRVRGTYGASKDPHAMSSRFVRAMKSFNVLVGMGSAVVSSVPDVARTVMVEGITNTHKKGLRNLFAANRNYIKNMKRRELRAAGIAADATLGLRAAAFSDIGDLFGSRMGFERGLNATTNAYFMLNGLNYWNQMLKEFAGNVTMLRMTDALTTNWAALSKADKEKLLKNGINQQDHYRMSVLIRKHGKKVEGEWMPETAAWEDSVMRLKFRTALNQNVDRIIVTPGAGDRALWTSTEFGSLMTQFKSYGQGAMVRVLTSGLQEKDIAFWQGAALMVGMAGFVNEYKRYQYGIEGEEDFDTKVLNAVDRSGVIGWFMDVNNAVEKLSDQKIGLGPMLTDQPQYRMTDAAKAGSVFGPAISNFSTGTKVLGDVLSGNVDQSTLDSGRFILPTGNHPALDPIYDGIFGQ